MKRKISFLLAVVCIVGMLTGCASQKEEEYATDFYAMDTFMSIKTYGDGAEQAAKDAEHYINQLENKISRTRDYSEIYQLNQTKSMQVSNETYAILQAAKEAAEETDGKFDPTVASVTDLWKIGTEDARLPTQTEIDQALSHIDYQNLVLGENNQVTLLNEAKIDLGGIGKGYAANEVVKMLKKEGVQKALISLAGNIYVVGKKSDNQGWNVGVANPDSPSDSLVSIELTEDESIVTSGDYERYFEQDGKVYHHIFDAKTGYPAENDLRSVTVLMKDSAKADAYATAMYVMGREVAMAFCQKQGIEGIFITKDHKIYATSGIHDRVKFLGDDTDYVYE